jgi:hypothetical protein
MISEHKKLLDLIGKYAVRRADDNWGWMLGGIVQAVLPDGRIVVKDEIFGQLAVWGKDTWRVAENHR